MINSAFNTAIEFNLELSLLMITILLARWLLKRFAQLYNLYWLWLALPLAPLIAIASNQIPLQQRTAIVEQLSAFQAVTGANTEPTDILRPDYRSHSTQSSDLLNTKAYPQGSTVEFRVVLGIFWLCGIVFFGLRLLHQHLSLRRILNRSHSCLDWKPQSKFDVVGVTIPEFSPAVYGFFKPTIYFPSDLSNQLNEEQLSLVLQHEEKHIEQGHLWLNLAWDILVCLNWCNPIIYIARRHFRHDQELFCDYLVLKNQQLPSQKAYGHALISTVSATHSVSLLCSWKMFDQLEERIMNIKSNHRKMTFGLLYLAIASVLSLSSLYAIAHADQPSSETKETEVKSKKIEKKVSSISIINIDNAGDKEITIKTDGKTFRKVDDERFIEENGKRRELTKEESDQFNELLRKSESYSKAASDKKRGIFDQERVFAFSFDTDEEVDWSEIEQKIEEAHKRGRIGMDSVEVYEFDMDDIDIDFEEIEKQIEKAHRWKEVSAFSFGEARSTDKRIERALREAEESNDLKIKKARKQLEKAQKELAERRAAMEKQRKEALEKLKTLEQLSKET